MTIVRPQRLALLLVVLTLGLALAVPAQASGFLVTRPEEGVTPPVRPWVVLAEEVSLRVRAPHAQVTVRQSIRNTSARPLAADLVVPVPHGATWSDVRLVDGRKARLAKALVGPAARSYLLGVLRRTHRSELIRFLGHDLFVVEVEAFAAGEVRTLVLKHDRRLPRAADGFELVHRVAGVHDAPAEGIELTVDVTVQSTAPLGPLWCPTHEAAIQRDGPLRLDAHVKARATQANDQIAFYGGPGGDRLGTLLVSRWPTERDYGTFALLVEPGPQTAEDRPRARCVTWVVDGSGSMAGAPIAQVRAGIRRALADFASVDLVQLIVYGERLQAAFEQPQPATPQAQQAMLDLLTAVRPTGGSDLGAALSRAMEATCPSGLPPYVILVTDGRPTAGETDAQALLDRVALRHATRPARIFPLGVGVDVNAVLLDRLALLTGGTPTYVPPRQDVQAPLEALAAGLRHPVLSDVRTDLGSLQPFDVLPASPPDLFAGERLLIVGHYRHGGETEIVLHGQDGALQREHHAILRVAARGQGVRLPTVERLWGLRRLAHVLDRARLQGAREPELLAEIVTVSARTGLLTEYTAALADPTAAAPGNTPVHVARVRGMLDGLNRRAVGAAGFAQALSNKGRRRALRPPAMPPAIVVAEPSDRDVRTETLSGVRSAGARWFYRRNGYGWVEAILVDPSAVEQVVTRWSEPFFALLRRVDQDDAECLALSGDVVLRLNGRTVRVQESG